MLTMFDDDYSVLAAMRAGACGYVLKGAQQDEIVRAIQSVAAGEAIFGPGVARLVLGPVTEPPAAETPFAQLTSREREVLDLIASGARNAEIARRMAIAPKTVLTTFPGPSPNSRSPTAARSSLWPATRAIVVG